jgi:hypothetical protein
MKITKYPKPTNDREAIARLVCMADDLAVSIEGATYALNELRAALSELIQAKVRYPDSCFAEPPPVKSRIPLPDDDDLLAFRQYTGY